MLCVDVCTEDNQRGSDRHFLISTKAKRGVGHMFLKEVMIQASAL